MFKTSILSSPLNVLLTKKMFLPKLQEFNGMSSKTNALFNKRNVFILNRHSVEGKLAKQIHDIRKPTNRDITYFIVCN